jgi:hypothetical protein
VSPSLLRKRNPGLRGIGRKGLEENGICGGWCK